MGERLADEPREALAAQTVTVPAEQTAGCVIAELAEEPDPLARRDQLKTRDRGVISLPPSGAGRALNPGNRVKTGARILTEIGDANRFPTAGSSPRTGSPQSPPSPAARSAASRGADAATGGSRRRSGYRRPARAGGLAARGSSP
jgi:hypothetical protein